MTNQPVGIPHQDPTNYTGWKQDIIPIKKFGKQPTASDKSFRVGQFAILGKNPTTGSEGDLWYLSKFESNGDANWIQFSASVSSGAWNFLSSQKASNVADIRFTTGIDSTYSTYALILSGVVPVTDDVVLKLEYSSDGGSSWIVTGYDFAAYGHNLDIGDIDESVTTYVPLTPNDQLGDAISNITLRGFSGQVMLTQLTTGDTPHADIHGSYLPSTVLTTFFAGMNAGGAGPDATTVNALRFIMSAGNIAEGEFSLYGITD